MTVFGVDYAWGRPGVAALKQAGVRFACRYLSHDTSGKNLDAAEARALSDADIAIVVVWESSASRALDGFAAGVADARAAAAQATACGMPVDRPVFFAVDFDATGRATRVLPYFQGAASVLTPDRVGVYGGIAAVRAVLDSGHARWAWQTYAWSGGVWDDRAQLQQYSNDHTIGGVGLDYDRAVKNDYGQWRVGWSPAPAPRPQEDTLQIQTDLAATQPLTIQPGERGSVAWDKEAYDPAGLHNAAQAALFPHHTAYYVATSQLVVDGQGAGDKLTLALAAYERTTDKRIKDEYSEDKVGDGTKTTYTLSGLVWMGASYKYRIDVENSGTRPITIVSAGLKIAR